MKPNVILIIGLLLCGVAFGAIGVDFVSFSWDAGGSSAATNGGAATKSAWDGGSPSDFFNTSTGAAIVSVNAVNVTTANAGSKLNINHAATTAVTTGTIALIDFAATYADAYYVVTFVDNENVTIAVAYSGDTTCDIDIGGTINGLANIVNTDLADASSVNCEVLIKGDETFAGDVTLSGGGGTALTMLRFLGVDSSWVRVVPTRTTASGGSIANYLLKTADNHMPKITLNAGIEFILNQDYIHVDGLYFTGNSVSNTGLVGSSSASFQIFSNCVFENASTAGGNSRATATNMYGLYDNCDFLCTGATGNIICVNMGSAATIINCRAVLSTSDTASRAFAVGYGSIVNSIVYDGAGIGAIKTTTTFPMVVANCTFENMLTCITLPSSGSNWGHYIVNNIAANCTNFIDNPAGVDHEVFAAFNHLYNNTTDYPTDIFGELGFQDLTSDPLFVSEANDDYNLQNASPANAPRPFGPGGAMPVIAGVGGGGVIGVGWN